MLNFTSLDTLFLPTDGLFGRRAIEACGELASAAPSAGDLRLSLRAARRIDSGGVALLLRTYSHLASQGRKLSLVDVEPTVQRTLERLGWRHLFVTARGASPVFEAAAVGT
jgi:anti-anti-sigma factor